MIQGVLICLLLPFVSSSDPPSTTSNSAIVDNGSRLTQLEQMITSLQSQVQTTNTELGTVKGNLKKTEDELVAVKTELKIAQTDVTILKQNLQKQPGLVEFENLKSQLESLRVSHNNLLQQINFTVIDTISADVKSNIMEIQSLKSALNTSTTINSTLVQSIATRLPSIEAEYKEILTRQNITDQDLAASKALAQSTAADVKTIKSSVDKISYDVNATHQELEVIKNKTYGQLDIEVVFMAFYATSRPLWIDLIFDTIVYNIGNSYNESTGIFTAPVSGTYILWANILFDAPFSHKYVYIYKGQQKLATGYPFGVNEKDIMDNRIATVTTVDHLSKGDQIHFETDSTNDGVYGYGSRYGGALLHSS